jgi:hypothetical protein
MLHFICGEYLGRYTKKNRYIAAVEAFYHLYGADELMELII